MTTTLAITFPWGRYHATAWGQHANEGTPEWPPSPWRIVRTLYSVWKNRLPYLDEATVISTLGKIASPPRYMIPPHTEAHTRHWMPEESHRLGSASNRDLVLDSFVVVPRNSEILVSWNVELDSDEERCLGALANEITYLGRAESVCSVRLAVEDAEHSGTWLAPATKAYEDATVSVLVPSHPLDLDGLSQRPDRLRRSGRIEPPGSIRVDYARVRPSSGHPQRRAGPPTTVPAVRFVIPENMRPSMRASVALGDLVRRSALSRYGRSRGGASTNLSGKAPDSRPLESQHAHAHYLSFARDGGPQATNVLVWVPAGLAPDELDAVTSLSGRVLKLPWPVRDLRPVRLSLENFGDPTDVVPEIVGPSRSWKSITPFAPSRHPGRLSFDAFIKNEVDRELAYRGHPPTRSVSLERGPWMSFRRHRPAGRERLEDARRAYGLRIEFEEPAHGPIAIGALSHFGLGLFVPTRDRDVD